MKKIFVLITLISIFVISCAKQEDSNGNNSGFGKGIIEITAMVQPMDGFGSSKTAIDGQGEFSWLANDKLAFFPEENDVAIGKPEQAMFFINPNSINGSRATFKSNGWGLLRNKFYYSYYPYDETATYNSLTLNYTGQEQKANNSTSHLGDYDYLYSSTTIPAEGGCTLQYNHLGCIGKFTLSIPDEYAHNKFTHMVLSTDAAVIVESAIYNPSSGTSTPTSRNMTDNISVSLNESEGGISCTSNQLIVYVMMNPAAWKGKTITVTLTDFTGYVYTGTFQPGIDQYLNPSGKGIIFNYAADMTCTSSEIDLSRAESANCYIVSKAGDYKFRAVQGNSNTAVNPASVGILWETTNTSEVPSVNTIIKNVDISNGYITFSTNDSFTSGNALIVAYSNDGTILWSWHIWCTETPEDEEYANEAGYLMDRNLGALGTIGDSSCGLLYQWGRKDPFPGPVDPNSTYFMGITADFDFEEHSSSDYGSIEASIKNPTTFIIGNNELDWIVPHNSSLWYGGAGIKTIYDPCPPGYRVPDGSTTANTIEGRGFWAKAFGCNYSMNENDYEYITDDKGYHYLKVPIKNGTTLYPCVNHIPESGGGLFVWHPFYHYINLWSNYHAGSSDGSDWNTQYSGNLDGNSTEEKVLVNYNSGSAAGKTVRCMKMNSKDIDASGTEGFGDTPSPSVW